MTLARLYSPALGKIGSNVSRKAQNTFATNCQTCQACCDGQNSSENPELPQRTSARAPLISESHGVVRKASKRNKKNPLRYAAVRCYSTETATTSATGGSHSVSDRQTYSGDAASPLEADTVSQNSPLQQLLKMPTLFDPIRKPRLPIVLCHGLYGFDSVGISLLPRYQYAYWRAVLEILKEHLEAEVIVTAVPAAGSIKERAEVLHQTLHKELRGKDFNIIAHSMGGLDARWLLSHIKPTSYRPRSLLTMSTPHRGSPFMAWCRDNIGVGSDPNHQPDLSPSPSVRLPYSLEKPILASKKRSTPDIGSALSAYMLKLLDSPAYSNLTPNYLANVFNPSTPNNDEVKYYSVAARQKKVGVWHPLWLPKLILDASDEKRSKETGKPASLGNDCLVPVESAVWGELLGIVEQCDHFELRGAGGFRSPPSSKSKQVGPSSSVATADASSKAADPSSSSPAWALGDVYEKVAALTDTNQDSGQQEIEKGKKSAPTSGWADWITKRIPKFSSNDSSTKQQQSQHSQRHPGYASLQEALRKAEEGTPLRFTTSKQPDSGRYNLEGLYIGLCRKLYDDGF